MPRKANQAPGLGNSLIKNRFGKKGSAHLHAAQLAAENFSDKNLLSVTELNSLDDFLATAELAGTEFTAERLNIRFVEAQTSGLLSESELSKQKRAQEEVEHLVGIPRRPSWCASTSKEELEKSEREEFLSWRRKLAEIQENDDISLTPYEKNLDFWRQLWRVIERSDVIVQIVDARNPLLFRCTDLETYVKEVDSKKKNILLVNKADLLSSQQRLVWRKYFESCGVEAIFWSAVLENEKLESQEEETEEQPPSDLDNGDLLTRDEFIAYLKGLVAGKEHKVVGMVGYPNVGKSSSVNTLMGVKKAAVSATPGRTKHFQTLHVDSELCLCDCPGLVFPTFVSNKAEMVLSGILPIDQMRDHISPVNLLCHRIPRKVIEVTYGVNIDLPPEGDDPERPPTPAEMLSAHALSRGFMTSHGQPDNSRSARIILKDYVNGKLLCSVNPPGVDREAYKEWTVSKVETALKVVRENLEVTEEMGSVVDRIHRINKKVTEQVSEVEREFFKPQEVKSFSKSFHPAENPTNKKKKHFKKKEKMRRLRTVEY